MRWSVHMSMFSFFAVVHTGVHVCVRAYLCVVEPQVSCVGFSTFVKMPLYLHSLVFVVPSCYRCCCGSHCCCCFSWSPCCCCCCLCLSCSFFLVVSQTWHFGQLGRLLEWRNGASADGLCVPWIWNYPNWSRKI